MIKAIIFDFFGVVGLSTYTMLAEKYKYSPEQYRQTWDLHRALDDGFVTYDEFLQDYADIIGISKQELVSSFKEAEGNMSINMPVIDFVDELRKEYKVGLLTNISDDRSYEFVEPIVSHFDEVVASYKVKIAKPEIAAFELIATKLDVDTSECVMIDDNETNCVGARAAGMQAILYQNIAQAKEDLGKILLA